MSDLDENTPIELTIDFNIADAEKSAKELEKEVKKIFDSRGVEQQSAAMTQQLVTMKKNAEVADQLVHKYQELREEREHISNSLGAKRDLQLVQDYVDRLTKLTNKMREMLDYTPNIQMPEGDMYSLHDLEKYIEGQRELEKQNKLTAEATQELRDMEQMYAEARDKAYSTIFKYDIEDTQGEVVHMSGTYEEYLNILAQISAGHEIMQKGFDNFGYSAEATAEKLADLNEELAATEEKLDQVNDKTTQQIIRFREMAEASEDNSAMINKSITATSSGLMGINLLVRNVARLIPGVSKEAITAVTSLSGGIRGLGRIIKTTLSSAMSAIVPLLPVLIPALIFLIKIIDTIKKIKTLVQTFGDVLKKVGSRALTFLRSIPAKLRNLLSLTLRLATVVERIFVKGIAAIIKKLMSLRSVIKENLDYMALWNHGVNDVNTSMSNLTSSLAYLKASLTTAFAPILTTVEPILTSLMDRLADVTTSIGIFIAQLMGKTSFQKAIREQKDYAEALRGTNKQLASFDKLNVIDKNANAEENMPIKFEEIEIEPLNLDVIDTLFDKATEMAETFTAALNKIPWKSIKNGAKTAAKGISNFVNGFAEFDGLGESVGKALGEVVNTITDFFDTLFKPSTGINFESLGEQFEKLFSKAIDIIDWEKLADTLWAGVKSALAFLRGFLKNNPGKKLGKAFSVFLKRALDKDNIPWKDIKKTLNAVVSNVVGFLNEIITPENLSLVGTTLGETLNTVFEAASTFAKEANWSVWGESIGTAINDFLKTWDLKLTTEAINRFVIGLEEAVLTAVNTVDWDLVGDKIAEFISGIDWSKIANYAVKISTKLREGLLKIWQKLSDTDGFFDLLQAFADYLNEKEKWTKMFSKIKKQLFVAAAIAWFGDTGAAEMLLKIYFPEVYEARQKKKQENLPTLDVGATQYTAGADMSEVVEQVQEGIKYLSAEDLYAMSAQGKKELEAKRLKEQEEMQATLELIAQDFANGIYGRAQYLDIKNMAESEKKRLVAQYGELSIARHMDDVTKAQLEEEKQINAALKEIIDDLNAGVYGPKTYININDLSYEEKKKLLSQYGGAASGTVIPPSMSERLVRVGDNNKEAEIISPISTIKQALQEVLAQQNVNVTFQVEGDPNGLFKVVQKESIRYNQRTGSSAFA